MTAATQTNKIKLNNSPSDEVPVLLGSMLPALCAGAMLCGTKI